MKNRISLILMVAIAFFVICLAVIFLFLNAKNNIAEKEIVAEISHSNDENIANSDSEELSNVDDVTAPTLTNVGSQILNPLIGNLKTEMIEPGNSPFRSFPGVALLTDDGSMLYLLTENGSAENLRIVGDNGNVDLPSFFGNTYFAFEGRDVDNYDDPLYVVIETDQPIKSVISCDDSSETCNPVVFDSIPEDRILFAVYPGEQYGISTRDLTGLK